MEWNVRIDGQYRQVIVRLAGPLTAVKGAVSEALVGISHGLIERIDTPGELVYEVFHKGFRHPSGTLRFFYDQSLIEILLENIRLSDGDVLGASEGFPIEAGRALAQKFAARGYIKPREQAQFLFAVYEELNRGKVN